MQRDKIGLIIDDTQVYAVDLKNKKRLRKIGPNGVEHAETDGYIIAIVYSNERTRCYDARRGSFLGHVGKNGISSLSAVDERLVIGHNQRPHEIINLKATFPAAYGGVEKKLSALIRAVQQRDR